MTNPQRSTEVVPNPDPSAITTQQIEKEVSSLEARIMARLDGMEKAVEVFHADLTRVPTSVDKAVLGLREIVETRLHCLEDDVKSVHKNIDTRATDIREQIGHLHDLAFERISKLSEVTGEKFDSINTTFSQNDKALTAALQAQEKQAIATNDSTRTANTKMEDGFTKLIDEQSKRIDGVTRNSDEKIDDLKQRLTTIESRTQGITQQKSESGLATTQNTSQFASIAAIAFGALMFLVGVGSLAINFNRASPPPQVVYAPAVPQTNAR